VTTRERRLVAIPGRPLSAFEVGEGCAFVARCPFAEERCRVERPLLRTVGRGRVACHRSEELQGQLDANKMREAARG
jgi:oligopeptide/dipeptide ABC transporter ATP-binding protein